MPVSTFKSPCSVPNDVIFVFEGTALCGAYLSELKENYIKPTIEFFSGEQAKENYDVGSDANDTLYGLVVFHASDILPGYLTDTHGPFTTPNKLISKMEKLRFAGGYGEGISHVGEGLATALQCLHDLEEFRSSPLETPPAKKHIILVCNCKPYGIPVSESVGIDGSFGGMTAEELASMMGYKEINLSILSPRKIPELMNLFNRAGGNSISQANYARDPKHLVLLNGYNLQVREQSSTPLKNNQTIIPAVPAPPKPQIAEPSSTTTSETFSMLQDPQQSQLHDPQYVQSSQISSSSASNPIIPTPRPMQPSNQPIKSPGMINLPPQINSQMTKVNTIDPPQINHQQQQMGVVNKPQQIPPQQMNQQQINQQVNQQQINHKQINHQINTPQVNQQINQQQINQQRNQQKLHQMNQQHRQHQINQAQPIGQQISGMQQISPPWQSPGMTSTQQTTQNMNVQIQPQKNQIMKTNPPNSSPQQSSALSSALAQPPQQSPNPTLLAQLQRQPLPATLPVALPTTPPVTQAQMIYIPNNNQNGGRRIIWGGLLEWHEKQKGLPEGQKIPRQVPCQVSANVVTNGEPEIKGEGWPPKLIMQLIPKAILGSLGGTFFRDVKTVLFNLQPCEALTSLTRVMDMGYAGCVHFTGMQSKLCTIKVLILLYSKERQAYLGLIPNDQAGFVDRIRKVIQEQKAQQGIMRQGILPGVGRTPSGLAGNSNQPAGNPSIVQQLGQPQMTIGNQAIRTPLLAQQLSKTTQQPTQSQFNPASISNTTNLSGLAPGAPTGPSNAQNNLALELERQQNLLKIQQLQQTLQQAQNIENQYQQLQSHSIRPIQGPAMGVINQAGQMERMTRPMVNPQMNQMQMMRGTARVAQANPRLRHLLQQQVAPMPKDSILPGIQQMNNIQRMPGQLHPGPMPVNQAGQFDDVEMLDLLKRTDY